MKKLRNKWFLPLFCAALLATGACSEDDTESGTREPLPPTLTTENIPDGGFSFLYSAQEPQTFLLSTDARGNAHLHLLWSSLTGNKLEVDADSLAKAPDWVRQFVAKSKTDVTRLTQAVETLPAGRFGHFITTDGRIFPGRYLKFSYDFLSKRFTITDYLFDDRRPIQTGKNKPESTSERVARERNHLLNSHTD